MAGLLTRLTAGLMLSAAWIMQTQASEVEVFGLSVPVPENWSQQGSGPVSLTEQGQDDTAAAHIEIFKGDGYDNSEIEGLISLADSQVAGRPVKRIDWKDDAMRGFALIFAESDNEGRHVTVSFRAPLARWPEIKSVFSSLAAGISVAGKTADDASTLVFVPPLGWTATMQQRRGAPTSVYRNPDAAAALKAVSITTLEGTVEHHVFAQFLAAFQREVVTAGFVTDVDEDTVAGVHARVASFMGQHRGSEVSARMYLIDAGNNPVLVTALADAAAPEALDTVKTMFSKGTPNQPFVATADDAGPTLASGDVDNAIPQFTPGPLREVLFAGEMDGRWRTNESAGGVYEGNATFEDGALVVRMPENHGWAKAGLISRQPIVWLDEFGKGAEATLSFTYDPSRTSGLGIAVGPWWSQDPWSMPGIYAQWNISADKTAGVLSVFKEQQAVAGSPQRVEGQLTAPRTFRLRLQPGKFILEAEGFAPIEVPEAKLQPDTGLYVSVFSSVPEAHLATRMALTNITWVRQPGEPIAEPAPAADVEPLPSEMIFPGKGAEQWQEMAVAGGDFVQHAQWGMDEFAVSVPENASWGKVGLLAKQPPFVLEPTDSLAPYRLRFTFDPERTRAFRIAIRGETGPDIDDQHWIAAGVSEGGGETMSLFVHSSNERQAERKVPRIPLRHFDLVIVRDRVTARLENGASVSLPVYAYGNGFQFHLAVMANPTAENEPTAFVLKSIEAGRVPPDGMNKAQRWLFVKDKEFSPGDFLDEIIGGEAPQQEGALASPALIQLADAGLVVSDTGTAWQLAQTEAPTEAPDAALRQRIQDRLSNLNREKLDALMAHVGRQPPKDFYSCLCGTYWRAGHVGVGYRDGKCHFSGFGEWDEPLPNDSATWASCIDQQRYEDGSSLVDVLAGEAKSLRDKTSSAGAPAGGLTQKGKGPASSVNDYDKLLAKHLTDLRQRGYPMNRIEQLNALVRKHIMTLNQPGALPGFWEGLGLASPPKEDAVELERWRRSMLEKWDTRFIGLLQSGNPHVIMDGIRQTSQALGKYDEGMHQAAEGALDEVSGNQKFVEDVMSSVPVVGDAMDVIVVAGWLAGDGEWTLSGDKVTALDALIRVAGIAGPAALEKLLGNSKAAAKLADEVGTATHTLGRSGAGKAVAKGVGRSTDDVAKGLEAISESVARKHKAAADTLGAKAAKAADDFAKTPEGVAEINRNMLDRKLASELVERLKRAEPGSPGFEDALKQLQANKTAQAIINGKDIPDALRKSAKAGVEGWYKTADTGTKANLKSLLGYSDDAKDAAKALGVSGAAAQKMRDQMAAYARAKGLPLEDFKIEVKTITNKRPADPGAPAKTSFGRDRDVTFEIVAPDGRRFDVDHQVSEAVYEQNFWKATNKGPLPMKDGRPDMEIIHGYAHETMDQTVTSKWHKEAYNPGEVALDDFLNKGMTPTITRVEDVRDTITIKSDVWFDRAAKSTEPTAQARHIAEGMRQASKQYEDIILSRMKSYGMNPAAVPPQLQASMTIFKRVETGEVTAKQAEAMLAAIGTSPQKAVKDMGSMFETMEKVTGKAARGEGQTYVAGVVKQMAAGGAPNWHNAALSEINTGLKSGMLTGTDFMKMRGEVIQDATRNLPAIARAPWAEAARAKGLISAAEFDMLMQQN